MILEIFSSYGKLEATPMTLQAIEKSILLESCSCHEDVVDNQVISDWKD